MLAFPSAIKIYVAVQPVDMRKSFNGLWSTVSEHLQDDPKSGAVYCFINAERTRLKLLYWDGTGVWVLAKRLERGLALLVGGVELKHGSLKPWYER
jgi:transposase